MKKILLLTLGVIAFATSSCISIHNNKAATANMPVATVQPAHYQAITEIGTAPVTTEVTGHSVLKIFSWGMPDTFADNGSFSGGSASPLPFIGGDSYAKFKQAAVYRACEENNCDSLMDARYVITKKNYVVYEQVNCKVIGTPVKITGYKLCEQK